MEAPTESANPTKPTRGRRVEPVPLAPPLPEDCTKVPFVLDMIRKSNAAVTSKHRIKSKQSLTSEAVRHSLLLKDRHLGEEIIRDSITVRQIFPKPDVAITPILHALYCAKEYKRGEALFYWVLGEARATSPEKEMLMMDDAVLTVGLRLVRAAGSTGDANGTINTSNAEIKRLLARVPKQMMKRRLLNTIVSGCVPDGQIIHVPDWDLMLHALQVGRDIDLEFWDKDFLGMLEVVEACDKAGLDYPKKDCINRILAAMEDHHPTVGKNVATMLCRIMSPSGGSQGKGGVVAEQEEGGEADVLVKNTSRVNADTGICSKCQSKMQGFTFSDSDFSRLEQDILDVLVEPSYRRRSHYERHIVEDVPLSEQQARRERFAEFKRAVDASDFDSLIDGANVGYYGVTNWYTLDKTKQLLQNGRDKDSIKSSEVSKMPLPIDICPRFELIDGVMDEAIRLGYNPKVVLHERHVVPSNRLFGENEELVQKWKNAGRLLDSPPFLNDDYCWLYACSVKKKCMLITNDQMRDHHFKMLSQRNFIRWRQRHRIQFRNGVHGLRVILPTVFSTWVQGAAMKERPNTTSWHIPYLNAPIIEQDTNKGMQEHTLGKDGDDGCHGWACLEL